ncbi:MAG: cbb3-type cytochrome c oxidase subunit I [Bdellovibrionales bacterium]
MAHAAPGENYLNHEKGLKSWLTTLDHKRIGVLYMITVLIFFAMGGFFALMLRTELASPGPGVLGTGGVYNQYMTLHGAIMVFMVIIPGIPAFLGNFVLPLHLGLRMWHSLD